MPLLLEKAGFRCLEVITPGKLDLDILCNNLDLVGDRFWKVFLQQATDDIKEQWQALISASCQSSHMMVTCRKL
jgi:hypothetical protein